MPLGDLIHVIASDRDDDPEDIFASAASLIFPDDLRNFHGDADSVLVYRSARFGDITLRSAEPQCERDRRLFAHYLWNAGIKLAELISAATGPWNVEDERVLELGAGVGLGGIVADLAGAREVVISDYPAQPVLENIRRNARGAIPTKRPQVGQYRVEGYEWGDVGETPFATAEAHSFTRILAADCFWMPYEHANLVASMLHFLRPSPSACVLAVAGFHTGRAKLAEFFTEAASQGLEIEDIYEEDANGVRRDWLSERDGGREDVTARKRWLVIAVLKRRTI